MLTSQLPEAPAAAGVSFRFFRDPQDCARLAEIESVGCLADGAKLMTTAEELASDWRRFPNFDPTRQVAVAERVGRAVMFGYYNWVTDEDGTLIPRLGGASVPEARRRGIGAALLHWQEARLREVAARVPHPGPTYFHTWAFSSATGKLALLERAGYSPFRHGFLMRRPLDIAIPDWQVPEDLEVRAMLPEHFARVFWAKDEAFRDHFGHHPATPAELAAFPQAPFARPELCQVAWDRASGEVAGAVLINVFAEENRALGLNRGCTDPIFVRRPWRKRGVARALIVRSMRALRDAGFDEAYLGVDALNPNGALALYEGLGYQTDIKTVRWRKALSESGSEDPGRDGAR